MAQVIRIHEHGGPEVLRLEAIDAGTPGPGEALVRQTAIGVNFIDTYHRSGLYKVPGLPCGIGSEAAGVVEAVGPDVTDVAPGDRVAYAGLSHGAYASERVVPAARLVPLPEQIDEVTAAAVLLKGMTAEYLVRRTFPVQPGQWAVVHAAAGGVGSILCPWLHTLGARVIGVVSSDAKADMARALGCAHVIVTPREPLVARVRELTAGRGVPVVYDSVGAATFMDSLDCLAPRGMLVSYGNASGRPPAIDPLALSEKGSLFLTRPALFHYIATREELLDSARAVFDVVSAGWVRPSIGATWPLAEAAEAQRALESRGSTGSIVLL